MESRCTGPVKLLSGTRRTGLSICNYMAPISFGGMNTVLKHAAMARALWTPSIFLCRLAYWGNWLIRSRCAQMCMRSLLFVKRRYRLFSADVDTRAKQSCQRLAPPLYGFAAKAWVYATKVSQTSPNTHRTKRLLEAKRRRRNAGFLDARIESF